MQQTKIFGPSDYRSMPWHNGLGETVELRKRMRPQGDGFLWRLSKADVASDGEFSNFSGYDRTLVLLEGAGICLDVAGARLELSSPLQKARFSGDETTFAYLYDGPVKDFNVITRRGECSARVVCNLDPGATRIEIETGLLMVYAVDGGLEASLPGQSAMSLPAEHLLVISKPGADWLDCHGAGYIAVQIDESQPSVA